MSDLRTVIIILTSNASNSINRLILIIIIINERTGDQSIILIVFNPIQTAWREGGAESVQTVFNLNSITVIMIKVDQPS